MMGENRKKGFWLDPRAKLFLILMCVLASMVAPSLGYQFILVLLIALLGVLFGKWKYAVNAVCFYAVICVLTVWIMRCSSSFSILIQINISHFPYLFPFTLRIYSFFCKDSIIRFTVLSDFPVSATRSFCLIDGFL